jgi:hypothetical protein
MESALRALYFVRLQLNRSVMPPRADDAYARTNLNTGESVMAAGARFPTRARAHVIAWLDIHRDELLADWELARNGRPLRPIAPLE